jgi:hypothetical protein
MTRKTDVQKIKVSSAALDLFLRHRFQQNHALEDGCKCGAFWHWMETYRGAYENHIRSLFSVTK